MNDYYYYTLIKPYIPVANQSILTKNDHLIIGKKRILNINNQLLLARIKLHSGSPCARYCTCPYFDDDDIIYYYKSTL